jgi:hypothetical protein
MAVNSQLSEKELLNRVVHYEARGEGVIGMALVALTIFNRQAIILANNNKGPGTFNAKGSSLKDILMGKNQYQPVSEGKVNKNISAEARENVAKALELARNPRALQSELNKAGLSNSEITSLINSTGFRTQGAKTDSSQPKAASYGNHNFTTAGNEDNALFTANESVASRPGIATGTEVSRGGPPVPAGTLVEDISTEDDVLEGGTGNPPDTLGGPRTEASNNVTPADVQTEALFPTSGAGPGSIPIPQDPNNYYSSNLSGEPVKQQQLNQTIPLSKLGERPLEDRELDAGLSTGTEKQERRTEAARLKRIKDMNYSKEELSNRQGELGLTNEQLDELSLTPEYSDDGYVNPTEDEYLGDILLGLFEQGDAVDEVSNQGYEEPSAMTEQNLAEGGPVERQVKFVKNNNDEEEEKELPDPPPGATPEEVADDVPAMLSTGEYVLPANIVRYIGLERIVGMHKSILFKLQQMADLGIIQNVDHNGDPEDDNTEMDFIQEPEVTSEKKLMVIIEPKGMMSPMHFFTGGGTGDDNPAADPNADNTDADTGSTDTGKGKGEDTTDADHAAFEASLVNESRNESGGETQGGPGFSGVHGMADPSEAGPGGSEFMNSVVENVARSLIGVRVDALVAAHNAGVQAQKDARAAGGKFDTGVNEGDHAQGFSGRGKGVDIGEPSGVSGAGDNPDDSIILKVEAPEVKSSSTAPPKVYISGLGLMSRGGLMGYHEGGAVVDDLGVVDYAEHAHEDTSVGVNYAPASYEDYKAKVFGTRLQDPAYGGKSPEDWAKSYEDSYAVDATENKRRKELASSLNFGRGSVTSYNEEGGNQVFKANKDVFNYLNSTQGLDSGEIATVINNFRDGNTNIFSGTSKFNFPSENEKAISFLTALAEGKNAQRQGITDADIQKGQTNRDVLKKIFAADFDGRASNNGEELISKSGRTAFDLLGNTEDKHNRYVKSKYDMDLDAPASVDAVNRFMPVISSGGVGGKNKYAGETFEDVVARGDQTPEEYRQGIMSSTAAAKNKRYVEGLGVV